MTEYTWNQILGLAAIYHGDSALEFDMKFSNWIKGRKYRIIDQASADQERQRAMTEGIEIFIIKE